MLIAFIGEPSFGQVEVMEFLHRNRKFKYARNFLTRRSRKGEYHKITLSESDFNEESEKGVIIFSNKYSGEKYGYYKKDIEAAIASLEDFWMMSFSIEHLEQLKDIENTLKIIILPESVEALKKAIIRYGNEQRENNILDIYNKHYAKLSEGENKATNTCTIIFHQGDIGNCIYKILKFVSENSELDSRKLLIYKRERLELILENIRHLPAFRSGLQAYKMLTTEINKFEDTIWGGGSFNQPLSFQSGNKSERIYTVLTESFYEVVGYTGVMLLLSRRELLFISRYGAIEIQEKNVEDKFGENCSFGKRQDQIIFTKLDAWGDGVWHNKNR